MPNARSATAGKSPTNGRLSNENENIVSSTRPMTGRSLATRMPSVSERRPDSGVFSARGSVIRSTADITIRYVQELMKKMCSVFRPAFISSAAMIGPATLEPFTDTDDRLIEPPRSSGGTRLGSTAENAGAFRLLPIPTTSWATKSAGIAASMPARTPRENEPVICTSCANTSHRRRSNLSAMTPAGMERRRSGPIWAMLNTATVEALCVREYT